MSLTGPKPKWPIRGGGMGEGLLGTSESRYNHWLLMSPFIKRPFCQCQMGFTEISVCSTDFNTLPVSLTSIPWLQNCLSETFFLIDYLQVQLQVINSFINSPPTQFSCSTDQSRWTLILPLSCYSNTIVNNVFPAFATRCHTQFSQ